MTALGAAPTARAYALAAEVLQRLGAEGRTLATCESLTGGLVGATLTSVPGSSAVYRGGLVTYATDLKHGLAGVDAVLLAADGAVSDRTALAMALGARDRCHADWALAVTGVAGPDPQEGQPVGTVFVAVAGPQETSVQQHLLAGDRHAVRSATVETALAELVAALPR